MLISSGVGPPINTGRPHVHIRICIRASREIPGRTIGGFQPDLTYSIQLRRVRIQRTLSLPIIEDARWLLLSPSPPRSSILPTELHPLAMNGPSIQARRCGRARSAGGPGRKARSRCAPSARTATMSPRCGQCGRSFSIAFRIFWLTIFISDGVVASPYRTHVSPRRSLGSFGPICMEDEGPAHSKDSTEKTGFKDDIVSRRSLTGSRVRRSRRAARRPVVLRKDERGEVDFVRKLEEPVQRDGPWIEGCRPGFDVRDVSRDRASAPAAASPVFLTSQRRCEACPSVPPARYFLERKRMSVKYR